MFDSTGLGRHRWQALINGMVIGLGFATIQTGFGLVFIVLGAGMEYWHRKRMKRE